VYRWEVTRSIDELARRLAGYGRRHGPSGLVDLGRIAAIEIVESNPHGRPVRYAISDEAGATVRLGAVRFRDAANFSGDGIEEPLERLRSCFLTPRIEPGRVVFEGHGFGHGVGLCQYGAQAMAAGGKGHREIVEWYYPGAEVRRAYV
jgi:SpoIID/LytB domain protein